MRLEDVALDEREHAYYAPRLGDLLLLGLLLVVLLGNGLLMWHQLGPENDHTGRAIFFGLALLCALWTAVVYTFKLSVCVRVGPHGVSVVRGPWSTELPWSQATRLVERVQMLGGHRLRWVVVFARDGRSIQIREDMVDDYLRFRMEVWERYRLWRDHGGTWGTTGGGPFSAAEEASTQTRWWAIAAAVIALPGLYFTFILPEVGLLGPTLLLITIVGVGMSVRTMVSRKRYNIDAKAIESRQLIGKVRLQWRDVARVERARTKFSGVMRAGIAMGQVALKIAARTDGRVQSFDWYPRVPEYLILRGTGRQVRVSLHRLAHPDEMLAWVEFYERLGRRATEAETPRRALAPASRQGRTTAKLAPAASMPDLSVPGGPADPWAAGQDGGFTETSETPGAPAEPSLPDAAATTEAAREQQAGAPSGPDESAAWLRDDSSSAWHPGPASPDEHYAAWQPEHQRPDESGANASYAPADPYTAQAPDPYSHAGYGWDAGGAQNPPAETPPAPAAFAPTQTYPDPWGSHAQSWSGGPSHETYDHHAAHDAWEPPVLPERRHESDHESQREEWMPDAVPPSAEGDAPAAVESLAESFAPWREDNSWQRPQLPRYGPAASSDTGHPGSSGSPDSDDFLR